MLPIVIILAAVGGLIVNHYTDNWLSEYTTRVYLDLNLDVYVSNSISVVKSTSSTLWNYSHPNGMTSAGQFVGPELVEIDLKEHWYLQGPPPVTTAPVIVSIPSESLGSYFSVLAVLLFLVMVGAFVFHSAATRARLSIVCLSVLPLFGGVQPVAEAAAGVPLFEDITAQTADVGPARAYALAPASMAELVTTPTLPTTNDLASTQVSQETNILEGSVPIAVGSTTLLVSNSTQTGFVEMDNTPLHQGSQTASTSNLPATATSAISAATTLILEDSSSIESGSPSAVSSTVVEGMALPPSASDTEALPLSSATTTSGSADAEIAIAALDLEPIVLNVVEPATGILVEAAAANLDNAESTESSNEEVVETVENDVDDSSESTPVNIDLPAKLTFFATISADAIASSSPLKVDAPIPTSISAAMNTTQQSDSPVEDVIEILPQPQPLPITETGTSISIAKETSDSSKDEPVALDLIEPVVESILATHQECLQASSSSSTSSTAWPCFAESLLLRERCISNESIDSGYQSSPNEATPSTPTTSQDFSAKSLSNLPPVVAEATQAQDSPNFESPTNNSNSQLEEPVQELMAPFTVSIRAPLVVQLPLVGKINNTLQQINEDPSIFEMIDLPGQEYYVDDSCTVEDVSDAAFETQMTGIAFETISVTVIDISTSSDANAVRNLVGKHVTKIRRSVFKKLTITKTVTKPGASAKRSISKFSPVEVAEAVTSPAEFFQGIIQPAESFQGLIAPAQVVEATLSPVLESVTPPPSSWNGKDTVTALQQYRQSREQKKSGGVIQVDKTNERKMKLMRFHQRQEFSAFKVKTLALEAQQEEGKNEKEIGELKRKTGRAGRWSMEWAKFQRIPRLIPDTREEGLLIDTQFVKLAGEDWFPRSFIEEVTPIKSGPGSTPTRIIESEAPSTPIDSVIAKSNGKESPSALQLYRHQQKMKLEKVFQITKANSWNFKLMRMNQRRAYTARREEDLKVQARREGNGEMTEMEMRIMRKENGKGGKWSNEWNCHQKIPITIPESREKGILIDNQEVLSIRRPRFQKIY